MVIGGSLFQEHLGSASSFFYATRTRIYGGVPYSPGFIYGIVMAGNSGFGYALGGGYYWKTTDSGLLWGNNVNNPHGIMSFYNDTLGLNMYLAPSQYYHFDLTKNSGNNWALIDSLRRYSSLFHEELLSEKIIVVVGDSGKILRNNNFVTNIKNKSEILPDKFSLSQNYPNPFNPVTKIKYTIAQRSPTGAFGDDKRGAFGDDKRGTFGDDRVVLKVYDILGKEIETLVNEKKSPGTYEVTFDGSRMASGIYFYTLIVENVTKQGLGNQVNSNNSGQVFKETKKLVLLK